MHPLPAHDRKRMGGVTMRAYRVCDPQSRRLGPARMPIERIPRKQETLNLKPVFPSSYVLLIPVKRKSVCARMGQTCENMETAWRTGSGRAGQVSAPLLGRTDVPRLQRREKRQNESTSMDRDLERIPEFRAEGLPKATAAADRPCHTTVLHLQSWDLQQGQNAKTVG